MLRSKIKNEIEKLMPYYINIFQDLIKYDSVYGNEREIQLSIKSVIEQLGLKTRMFFTRNDNESMNQVSEIKGTDSLNYKSLTLNAHCDIALLDGIDRWNRRPFSADISDNIIYGRGSQDDKAGIIIILLIANIIKNMDIKLKGDLILQFVIEDETTGNGSKLLADNGYISDGVIIVDGTWSNRIVYGHLGQIWVNAEIIGEPVAACIEGRGINPIYIGMDFIDRLKCFIQDLRSMGDVFEGIENPYFFNTGSFHSGVWAGSVPSNAALEIQIGFSDKYTPDEILRKVREIAGKVSDRITIKEGLLKTPAFKVNKEGSLITGLQGFIKKNTNMDVQLAAIIGYCDMRHFQTQDVCLYGPGKGSNAHGIDECYYLDEIPIITENLICFIKEWCNTMR